MSLSWTGKSAQLRLAEVAARSDDGLARRAHDLGALDTPTRALRVRNAISWIRREQGTPQSEKQAFHLDDLRLTVAALPKTLESKRDAVLRNRDGSGSGAISLRSEPAGDPENLASWQGAGSLRRKVLAALALRKRRRM